ncbi:MAG: hypothetical protein Q8N53_19750 [Longimicrobiales bacterium]|nr:hypothetical protein [Longimicrobiales bacterium]
MIFKRYGTSYQSVDPNFDSKALNEIGFRRDQEMVVPVAEFEAGYENVTTHELAAEAEGPVQDHTEQLLLDRLEASLLELEAGLESDHVLVFGNGDGTDYPKTRQAVRNVIVEGENRLHFTYTVGPPLRMGVYRKKT